MPEELPDRGRLARESFLGKVGEERSTRPAKPLERTFVLVTRGVPKEVQREGNRGGPA